MATRQELEEEISFLRGELRLQRGRLARALKINRKIVAENKRLMQAIDQSKVLASVIQEIKAVFADSNKNQTKKTRK